ncbi:hypothetical protein EKK58_10355 [Candidatus Dependentiae bacterium]|nr:MAG: hypothetical protein EKK58_10355 [Candidatus Dependentiae bacterium]
MLNKPIIVLDKTVNEWQVPDITKDMFVDARHLDLPTDEDGFVKGKFRITMEWIPDDSCPTT